MKAIWLLLPVSIALASCAPVIAQNDITEGRSQTVSWSFELHGGLPYNIPAPLAVKQNNHETLHMRAEYRSEPFRAPFYWVWRIARQKNDKSWEIEAIHHKLFLNNPPPEIQYFSITHGYNVFTVNRSYNKTINEKHPVIIRLGAGVVLSHPENNIRGAELDQGGGISGTGYYISGPVLNVSAARRFYLLSWLFMNAELKFYPSFSRVPVAEGYASAWSLPVAFIIGFGFELNY